MQALVDAGATVRRAVTDVGGGKLIAWLVDTDDNVTGLVHTPTAS